MDLKSNAAIRAPGKHDRQHISWTQCLEKLHAGQSPRRSEAGERAPGLLFDQTHDLGHPRNDGVTREMAIEVAKVRRNADLHPGNIVRRALNWAVLKVGVHARVLADHGLERSRLTPDSTSRY